MKKKQILALTLAVSMLGSTACTASAASGSKSETKIVLSDTKVKVDGKTASTKDTAAVYTGAEIIYYKDGTDDTYGKGTEAEKHSAEEAAAHTVVTITQPGTYRISGTLSQGQIAIDLGKDAKDDPDAVVTLILDNADVTCTVAPALIFYNVYECDREFVTYDDDANPDYESTAVVDTTAAGANVILAAGSENTFTGSHVARIYKEGTTKKLHKYDGAFYSKMSMNIDGDNGDDSGVLNIIADNEGLDTELHLTLNGGTVNIEAQDDGINTNEDLISVTTINGGKLTVNAGLGDEGDGVDSNGYLVINGGEVWTMANERTPDGGIDADSPILINGGTVSAFGTRNDAADTASAQPYMELAFASTLPAGSVVTVKDPAGNEIWTATTQKACQSITLTTSKMELNVAYQVYVDGVLQCWNGNSFGMGHPGGMGGQRPEGMEFPEGFDPSQEGNRPPFGEPDAQIPPQPGEDGAIASEPAPGQGQRPDGMGQGDFNPDQMTKDFKGNGQQGGMTPPEGFDGQMNQRPEDMGGMGQGGFGGGFPGFGDEQADGSGSTEFTLTESNKSFSGVCDSDASGKTRVSFTVDGVERNGRNTVISSITAITSSVEIDPALVQITVADDPSEDYSASCLLSEGLEAVNALLPTAEGNYTLTVAVVTGTEGFTGATQTSFRVGVLPFRDLREEETGYDAVKLLYNAGVLKGTAADTFSPEMTVTRAQAVTALFRLAEGESKTSETFSDVPADAWYAGAVGWAVENGIVEGDGQGHFFPETVVTAEHMALMLERLEENYVNSTSFSGSLNRLQMAQMLADIAE